VSRPTVAEIDLEALRFNLEQLKKLAGEKVEVLAVVKANAYGHGAPEVARELEAAGARIFAVATTEEGIELRVSGIRAPILILAGTYADEFDRITANRLTPVIYDLEIARAFNARAEKERMRLPVHLKIDTGMTRLGIPWRQWEAGLEVMGSLKRLRVEGLLSHFSVAEGGADEDRAFTEEQVRRFTRCVDLARRKGLSPRYIHMANSAAAAREAARFNLVRPGLMLYGYHPSPALRSVVSLKPVLRWKTAVLSLKQAPKGDPVSYGRTFCCPENSLIAVLPVGYGDGYSRLLSGRGEVLIGGRRAKIAGIVCMDMTMVDVSEIPGVKAGDEVVLLGRQEGDEISAVEIAGWTGSIPYEVLCGIGKRVPRVYRRGQG
jgi:alanine racemase